MSGVNGTPAWRPQAPREEAWHDLGDGLKVKLRPVTTAVRLAVQARVADLVGRLREGRTTVTELGLRIDDFGALADEHVLTGASMLASAVAFAEALLTDWNVGDGAEGVAEIKPETIRQVLNEEVGGFGVYERFLMAINRDVQARLDEGNVSRPPRTGSGAAASNTAKGAGRSKPTRAAARPARST